jgi:hypothetical protein
LRLFADALAKRFKLPEAFRNYAHEKAPHFGGA